MLGDLHGAHISQMSKINQNCIKMLKSWWFVKAADRKKCARKLNVTNLVDESALKDAFPATYTNVFGPKHDVGPNDLSVDERILFSSRLLDDSAEASSLPYPFIIGGVACKTPQNYAIFVRTIEACKSLHDALMGDPDVDAEVYWTRADAACKARGAGCESGGGIGMPLVSFSRDPRLAASARAGLAIFANGIDGLRQPDVLESILRDCNAADVFNAVDTTKVKAKLAAAIVREHGTKAIALSSDDNLDADVDPEIRNTQLCSAVGAVIAWRQFCNEAEDPDCIVGGTPAVDAVVSVCEQHHGDLVSELATKCVRKAAELGFC